jgi:hypothetical protein
MKILMAWKAIMNQWNNSIIENMKMTIINENDNVYSAMKY